MKIRIFNGGNVRCMTIVISLCISVILFSCKKDNSCKVCPDFTPPIAKAGDDVTIVLPQNSAVLDGTASSDPDGKLTSFHWVRVSGPAGSLIDDSFAAKTVVKNLTEGYYHFELLVVNSSGLYSRDSLRIFVKHFGVNMLPVAKIEANTDFLKLSSVLDAGSSFDPDGKIVSYEWKKITGPASYNISDPQKINTQITGLTTGIYRFQLTVTDNGGQSASDTVQISTNTPTCFADNLSWSLEPNGMMALIDRKNWPHIASFSCSGFGAAGLLPLHYNVSIKFEGSATLRHLKFVPRDQIGLTRESIFLTSVEYYDPNDGGLSFPIVYAKKDSGIDFTKTATIINNN